MLVASPKHAKDKFSCVACVCHWLKWLAAAAVGPDAGVVNATDVKPPELEKTADTVGFVRIAMVSMMRSRRCQGVPSATQRKTMSNGANVDGRENCANAACLCVTNAFHIMTRSCAVGAGAVSQIGLGVASNAK